MAIVKGKVAIGLSGGVDSSVAAALLKEQGFDVCAITMMTYVSSEALQESKRHGCYGPGEAEDVASAESVCKKLGIAFHAIDLRKEYQTHVIKHFRHEYLAGRTPNPCVVCNREVKFGFLLEKAKKSGIEFDFFATGHYAIIEKNGGRYLLKRAKDHSKDQSYFLYALTLDQLSTTLFPLGTYKKPQVREIARPLGLQTSERPESQDFIANGNYGILFNKNDATEGDIVDEKGNVLGKHRGIIHYTIGQRRGLGIAYGRPLYVTKIDAENNRIVVSDKEDLFSKGFIASDLNLIAIEGLDSPLEASVKIRLNHLAVQATVFPHDGEKARILFNKPQKAVCPGQHAVFYNEETVIGGGVIEEAL
jgi:tRNA-specific 2-thiouridylase